MHVGTAAEGYIERRFSDTAESGMPSLGVLVLCAFTLVAIGRVMEVIPALKAIRFGLLVGVGSIAYWLFSSGSFEEKLAWPIKQVRYIATLFALGIILVPVSAWPSHSLEFVLLMLPKTVILFFMALLWCRRSRDVRTIMWAYVISGVFQALFRAATDEAGNRTYTEDGSFDPNDVALFMVTAIPFAVHLIASAKSWIGRVMPMGMLAILLYGLVRTQSRGGFIAFVVVMGIFLLRGRMSMSVRAVAVAMAFIVLLGAGTKYWDRIETIWAPKTELDRGGSGRIAIWKEGAYLMLQRPWGWGIDTSTTAEGSQHQGGKWNAMHNSFLQVGVELGVVGAAAFVLLLGTTLRELRAVPKNASEYVGLASTLELSLYGFSVAAIFLSQAYGAFVYLLLGLSVAVIRMARRDEPETSALSTYQPARAAGYYYVPSGSSR